MTFWNEGVTLKQKIGYFAGVSFIAVVVLFLVIMLSSVAMAQSFESHCVNETTLIERADFAVNDVAYNITFKEKYCPLGCITNASQYGDDCRINETERTDNGMAIAGLIAISIVMLAFFYLAISIGSQHAPIQILLISIGMFLGSAVLWFARVLAFNSGQTTIAGYMDYIFGGYLMITLMIITYFPAKWYIDAMRRQKLGDDDDED